MIISYEPDSFPPAGDPVSRLGRRCGMFLRDAGRGTLLVLQAFAGIPRALAASRGDIGRALGQCGIR